MGFTVPLSSLSSDIIRRGFVWAAIWIAWVWLTLILGFLFVLFLTDVFSEFAGLVMIIFQFVGWWIGGQFGPFFREGYFDRVNDEAGLVVLGGAWRAAMASILGFGIPVVGTLMAVIVLGSENGIRHWSDIVVFPAVILPASALAGILIRDAWITKRMEQRK